MNERELESKKKYFLDFKNNVIRSMNIKLKIAKNRTEALRILAVNPQDPKGVAILRTCVKNEKNLLKVITPGLNEAITELQKIYELFSQATDNKELKNNTKKLLEIFVAFALGLQDTERRLALEQAFIENPNEDSFKRFVEQWDIELKANIQLTKKVFDIVEINEYFTKLLTSVTSSNKLNVGIGLGAGAVIGTIAILPGFPPSAVILGFIIGAAIATSGLALKIAEEDVEALCIKELEKAKKQIKRNK